MTKNKKALLHSCCAICSAYPIQYLRELGFEPIVFFSNSNIQPEEEYIKRLDAQRTLCEHFDAELIEDEYEPKMFDIISFGLEDEPEGGLRCPKCFKLRLTETAKKTKELGIDKFTTSIVISPHKNFQKISAIAGAVAEKYGVEFMPVDFKKKDGFVKSNKIAKELDLYRQNYCGCSYSIRN